MKVAVVYWSGTGNTELMANKVAEGAEEQGAKAELIEASGFSGGQMDVYDAVAFGCPSMGAEELEEETFAPMFESCKPKLKEKKIALFGSYGWGDGEWMENWAQECRRLGALLVCESVICNDAPDETAQEACRQMGRALCSW